MSAPGLVASYRDSSGIYTLYRFGDWLAGDLAGEQSAWRLERAPELDASPMAGDYELAPGFSSLDDSAELPAPYRFRRDVAGAVWIDGEAYVLSGWMGTDEAYALVLADQAQGFTPEELEEIEDQGGIFARVRETLALPGTGVRDELDVDDSRTFAAYVLALIPRA
jgi:hypothetical protein